MSQDVLAITGGASGIGLASAVAMAGDHGAIALLDQNPEALATAAKDAAFGERPVHTFECDVSDAVAMIELARRVETDIGPVRTLVTSAGILHNPATVLDMDLAEHNRVWDVNYHGTLYTIRAFAPAMTERGIGAIVTLGSINSFAALPLPAYCPSKTALMRLTEMLSVELGRKGVRINGVAPTYVLTPALKAKIASGDRDENLIRRAGALDMFVHPEHVASVIRFLCSDAAAAVTGVMLPVDAGWQAATTFNTFVGGVPWQD
ncbi:MAG: SDR family oxidoreductase [Rhizobiales bacterium]|nr:SDR family oxidoreductase [Hyphomicrobiales bacterium]